jgi:hypothetical protein
MELIILHLLTHEVPILAVGVLSLIFGKRAVLAYVRKHDPVVQELRDAANDAAFILDGDVCARLYKAIAAIEKGCPHDH